MTVGSDTDLDWQPARLVSWDHTVERGQAALADGGVVMVNIIMLSGGLTATLAAGQRVEVAMTGDTPTRFRQGRG